MVIYQVTNADTHFWRYNLKLQHMEVQYSNFLNIHVFGYYVLLVLFVYVTRTGADLVVWGHQAKGSVWPHESKISYFIRSIVSTFKHEMTDQ